MLKVANSVISASRITGVLPVLNGGTGVTTSTGTGNTVLSATPTLSGDVTLSTGNLVIGTAGKGIDFTATSSGSGTMTSELLADYEEGTFTPTIGSTGTQPTITYAIQIGNYTKVGRMIYFTAEITITAATGGTGALLLNGLPFAAGSSRYVGGATVTYSSGWTSQTPQNGYVYQGNSYVNLGYDGVTGTGQSTVANLTNGTMNLYVVGWYTA